MSASANSAASSGTRVAVANNLYALRKARLGAVRDAVSLLNPGISFQAAEAQADLIITEAFHRAANYVVRRADLRILGVAASAMTGTICSVNDIIDMNIIFGRINSVSVAGSIVCAAALGACALIYVSNFIRADELAMQGNMENGYTANEDARGNDKVFKEALRIVDNFTASAMSKSQPSPGG